MTRRIEGFALAACLFACAATVPQTHPSPLLDARLESQLLQIDAAATQVKDLSARFEQSKFTALLKKPLVSTDRLIAGAGSVIRWDTEQPEPCAMYADHANLILYYPQQKLEEVYPIDQRLSDLLTSPLPRLSAIEDHFLIQPANPADLAQMSAPQRPYDNPTLALRLTPSDPALARHIQQVIVLLDLKTGLTLAVQTTDSDGDRTQITFSDMRTNTGLQPSRLELKVPADVTISHPLDSAPTAESPNGSP